MSAITSQGRSPRLEYLQSRVISLNRAPSCRRKTVAPTVGLPQVPRVLSASLAGLISLCAVAITKAWSGVGLGVPWGV